MKKLVFTLTSALLLAFSANAQVIYSLPSSSINLNVSAEKENFIAGPYAKYAQKYLGAAARTSDAVTYTLTQITVKSFVEADPSEVHMARFSAKSAAEESFFQMTAQGLILYSDSPESKKEEWRFPAASIENAFADKDLGENLTSTTTTLYKNVNNGKGFTKVAVQQSEVVEKSLEKKAAEAAQRIFDLRKSRLQIVTGDTDATYSGEAMGAALKEISRMEQEYLSLFYGISETSVQKMNFDVVPTKENTKQMYVAFRISETEGLLPNSDVSGRPIVLQLDLDEQVKVPEKTTSKNFRKSANEMYYRIPVTATVRLVDSQKILLQTRMPIYQLGTKMTITL